MAEQLIDQLVTDFDPAAYHDTYQQRVTELLEAKAEGTEIEAAEPEEEVAGVVDLMSALEQSLQRAGGGSAGSEGGGDGGERDYASMSKSALYDLAQERDIPGRSSMSKDELIAALEDTDGASAAA